MDAELLLDMTVRAACRPVADVVALSLSSTNGAELPNWQPGAHVDVHLPSGAVRQYSLIGDPQEPHEYQIAVRRVAEGRGGSVELHAVARPGVTLRIGPPRNNFGLDPAPHYVFVAGGIGITALLPMIRTLARAASWQLIYVGRQRATMAFADELESFGGAAVEVVATDERGRPDLAATVHKAPNGTILYCCGPQSMVDAISTARSELRPDIAVRTELFTPRRLDTTSTDTAFEVVLARSQVTVTVPAGVSMLDAVRTVHPDVMSSCERGVCSACETAVLSGIPDHRDGVLTPAERAANRYVMLCVSRAKTAQLVLDL